MPPATSGGGNDDDDDDDDDDERDCDGHAHHQHQHVQQMKDRDEHPYVKTMAQSTFFTSWTNWFPLVASSSFIFSLHLDLRTPPLFSCLHPFRTYCLKMSALTVPIRPVTGPHGCTEILILPSFAHNVRSP